MRELRPQDRRVQAGRAGAPEREVLGADPLVAEGQRLFPGALDELARSPS